MCTFDEILTCSWQRTWRGCGEFEARPSCFGCSASRSPSPRSGDCVRTFRSVTKDWIHSSQLQLWLKPYPPSIKTFNSNDQNYRERCILIMYTISWYKTFILQAYLAMLTLVKQNLCICICTCIKNLYQVYVLYKYTGNWKLCY